MAKGRTAYVLANRLVKFFASRALRKARGKDIRGSASGWTESRRWGWEENIYGVFLGQKADKSTGILSPCIIFLVKKKIAEHRLSTRMRIPRIIDWKWIGGAVQTDIVATGQQMQTQSFRASDHVGHVLAGSGTTTLILDQNGNRVGLSCSHVIARYGRADEGDVVESPPDLNSDLPLNEIGRLLSGSSILSPNRASKTDAALFTVPVDADTAVPGIGVPSALSALSAQDIAAAGRSVIRCGRGTNLQAGVITGWKGSVTLRDDVLGFVQYEDAVLYSSDNAKGDSGAAVFWQGTTEVIGMHVAGDPVSRASLFLPISHAVNKLGVALPQ